MTSAGQPNRRSGPGHQPGCGHYMMVHKEPWENYILALDFKISKKCNSGIFIRTASLTPRPGKDVGFNGLEVAIDDTTGAGYYDTGAIYDLAKPTKNAMKPVGEWNHIVITCARSRITIELNGETVTNLDADEFTRPNLRPDGTAHKFDVAYKDHPRKGYIGLQDHGSPCWFKNIVLETARSRTGEAGAPAWACSAAGRGGGLAPPSRVRVARVGRFTGRRHPAAARRDRAARGPRPSGG